MSNEGSIVPTLRDVLNGRGQGVQRHHGNIKYRALVFVNKGLYAKCPRSDKSKISKGIVAAVRELGGRFLELNERTGEYFDIGDKKAIDKTFQALREGQRKIRQELYKAEGKGGEKRGNIGSKDYDTSLLTSSITTAATVPTSNINKGVSQEGYFGYSVQVLEALYNAEDNSPKPTQSVPFGVAAPAGINASIARAEEALPTGFTNQSHLQVPQQMRQSQMGATTERPIVVGMPLGVGAPAAMNAIARAAEQFPTATGFTLQSHQQVPRQMQPNHQQPPKYSGFEARASTESMHRQSNVSTQSIGSAFTFRNSLLSQFGEERKSIESICTAEIVDLMRQSEPQLKQIEINIENMNLVEFLLSSAFGERSSDSFSISIFSSASDPSRNTISSRDSVMEGSVLTIPRDDMSMLSRKGSVDRVMPERHQPCVPGMIEDVNDVDESTRISAMSLSSVGDLFRLSLDSSCANSGDGTGWKGIIGSLRESFQRSSGRMSMKNLICRRH